MTGPHLVMEVDQIPVYTAGGPAPDPKWTYTDKAGHQHHCDLDGSNAGEKWPTLKWVVDDTYWCESCHDDHEEGHWECKDCGEHIEPGMVVKGPRTLMLPGRVRYLIDDREVDKDEYEAAVRASEEHRREREAWICPRCEAEGEPHSACPRGCKIALAGTDAKIKNVIDGTQLSVMCVRVEKEPNGKS